MGYRLQILWDRDLAALRQDKVKRSTQSFSNVKTEKAAMNIISKRVKKNILEAIWYDKLNNPIVLIKTVRKPKKVKKAVKNLEPAEV